MFETLNAIGLEGIVSLLLANFEWVAIASMIVGFCTGVVHGMLMNPRSRLFKIVNRKAVNHKE